MHSEAEIRRAIKPLLDVYGELNTSEVKELLHTVLEFDIEDKEQSSSRNEMKIIQRIGNIVAHQDEKQKQYQEGFLVDKSVRPSKFILINPIENTIITSGEIKVKKEKRNSYKAKIVDWDKIRERNNEVGDQGEEFIMEFERDRLKEEGINDSIRLVQHLSRLQGDGLGYDISSINNDGSTRFIEVKTTTKGVEHSFYMTENEKGFFREYKEQAFIYRVYNFNKETRKGKVKIISAEDLFTNYKFDPITWKVSPKN